MKKAMMMIAITAALLMAPLAASARVAVVVGPRFGWGGGWGWYAPYWGPYPYYGYYGYGPATGELKFDTHVKDAQVYINGSYAGTVGEVKTMHLRPGSYDVEVREQGRSPFDQNIYVAAGKTLHLKPDVPQEQP